MLKNFPFTKNMDEEKKENENNKANAKIKWDIKDLLTYESFIRIIILLGLCWLFYYVNRNNSVFNKVFFNSDINNS